MTEQPSPILLQQVTQIIEQRIGIIAEHEHCTLLKAPEGGLEKKIILVPAGSTPQERKRSCIGIVRFLRELNMPLRIWQELLDQQGVVIIDNLTTSQLEALAEYDPPTT